MQTNILVTYKSVTGFTAQYAGWIAQELDCTVMDLKDVSAKTMSAYDTIIFGGRFHAGFVDGLKKAKKLFDASTAAKLIVFATGATLQTAEDMIAETWKNNFTSDELRDIPHFYMQSGLRYETMPFGDRLMLKVFAAMLKRKQDKSEYEQAMEAALGRSYDFSSKEYIKPLLSYFKK